MEFVELMNIGVRDYGWKDIGEYWWFWYEVDDLEGMVEGFWNEFKLFY